MKVFVSSTSFLKPQNAAAKAMLEEFFDEVTYNEKGVPLKGRDILNHLQGCDAYIAGLDYITAEVIAGMPKSLKVISRYGVGFDRVDVQAAKARKIVVTNTPGANSTSVCELAFCLMLCAARNVLQLHNQVNGGGWPRSEGMELAGRTLGIVGMGAIGKRLAVRAKAFDMKIVAYDPYFDESFAEKNGILRMELDELLAFADVISLHVPLTEETRHMISAERISRMRDGAIIINTARGGLIDEQAASEAIRSGKLGGMGLDAFEDEPLVNSPLKDLRNVILTPHTGAHTVEAMQKMATMAVENAIAVLRGEDCRFVIR